MTADDKHDQTDAAEQPGYAERDASETTEPTGGAPATSDDAPQGGEHFGEAPLGEQDPADEDEALGGN
jgi:hypothetical protein